MNLKNTSTRAPKDIDKDQAKEQTKEYVKRIGELQNLMYASRKHSLLLVLQGMDASGKDGTTKGLFRASSAAGVSAYSFKKPSEEEFAHDFLWRVHKLAPERGYVRVFIRSHYEDILVQHVHGWIDAAKRDRRMASINAFEQLLQEDSHTVVLKFFLHISPEEQLEKLQERVDDPTKNWKHNDGDWEERKLWDDYQAAYEYVLDKSAIKWHIIPADQEWYRDYLAAKIVCETLEALNMDYPPLKSELFKKV
jgi:PPK2 family polyphosphate:nucleotide phosphotransferase